MKTVNIVTDYYFRGACELRLDGFNEDCWVVWLDDTLLIFEHDESDGYRSYYTDPEFKEATILTEDQMLGFALKEEPLLVRVADDDSKLVKKEFDQGFDGHVFIPSPTYWKDEPIIIGYVGTDNTDDYYPCAASDNYVVNIDKAFRKQMEVLLEDEIWGGEDV